MPVSHVGAVACVRNVVPIASDSALCCLFPSGMPLAGWLAAVVFYVLWLSEEKGPALVGCHYTFVPLIQMIPNESYENCHHLGLYGNQHPHLTLSQILILSQYQSKPVQAISYFFPFLFSPCFVLFFFFLICLIPLHFLLHTATFFLPFSPLFFPHCSILLLFLTSLCLSFDYFYPSLPCIASLAFSVLAFIPGLAFI